MTALLAILKLAWPYMLAAAVGGAIAGWTTHAFDSIALNRQRAAMDGYKAQVADSDAAAEKAAREALQAQIDEGHANDVRNQSAIESLNGQLASIDRTRGDLTGELRHALANKPAACGGSVPQTPSQPGAAATVQASGDGPLAGLLSDAISECNGNRATQDALTAQIKPQVDKP